MAQVLIHIPTQKICDVYSYLRDRFPVHEDFEWQQRSDINRSMIGWYLVNDVPTPPLEKNVGPDPFTQLNERVKKLEDKSK